MAGSPLLVQDLFEQAPAFPTAAGRRAALQAGAGGRGVEGAHASPGSSDGGLAHLAGQPFDLVQPQEPLGPRVFPQLLPKGLQPCGNKSRG